MRRLLMNGKFIVLTCLAASVLLVCMPVVSVDSKTIKKHNLHCPKKNHLLLFGCSKSSTNTASDSGTHGSGGGGGGGTRTSDIRRKHDLYLIGRTVYGLPLYDFEYNGQIGTYEGVMAQDVLKVKPEAVTTGADGFYRVNYTMLGLRLKRVR
jgi:hypothetical protein